MKTNIMLILLVLIVLLTGCNLFSVPDKEKSGLSQFFITDSTGTERYTFHVNEPIFVHYKIINNTNHDIFYKKIPYMGDNALFMYEIWTSETESYTSIGYPPNHLQDTFLPKHESREQVYKIEGLKANEYRIKLELLIFFIHLNDFDRNYKSELPIKVEE